MIFHLGTHEPSWLADLRFADVPLFLARQRFAGRHGVARKRKRPPRLPRAVGSWACDSGGFTELQQHGRWTITPAEYVAEVRRLRDEVGGLAWAAPQDWMCEPIVIKGGTAARGITFAGTGLSVEEHQRRTVQNFLELRKLAPDLPFVPVLQGWSVYDYWRCEELYRKAGVDLQAEPLVGVGTVCRRQGTGAATLIMKSLAASGLRLHGFGFKVLGLRASAPDLASADSLAWSDTARRAEPLPGHDKPGDGRRTGHINCANCLEYALAWRAQLLEQLDQQVSAGPLFDARPAA